MTIKPSEYIAEGDWPAVQRMSESLQLRLAQPTPQARVFNSAAIATTTAAFKTLTFDSERYDNGSLHSTSANTSRLTAPVTGVYMIGAHAEFASNATGYREMVLTVNGATNIAVDTQPAVNGQTTVMTLLTQYRLAATDYVEVQVFQNSGGNLNVNASANYSPEFWIIRLAGYSGEQFS